MTVTGEQKVEQAQRSTEANRARLSRAAEKLILASIGAVALGKESAERMLNRMVERGEQVQASARQQAEAFRDKRRQLMGRGKQQVETALDAVDLPSKADIQSLQAQIAALSAKVDRMSVERPKPTTQVQP